ncbi:MAG: TetR/AcrR family transcriptional regulator [Actinomycetota bacterium]
MATADPASSMGRPREFDRDAVLDAIIGLFWEQGFRATSVGDIVERTGLSKSSLYGAFGSKEALFETALDRYIVEHERMVDERLVHGTRGFDDIEAFFRRGEEPVEPTPPRGCLAINTATEMRHADPVLVDLGVRHRRALRRGFTAALTRAVDLGEVEEQRVGHLANNLVTAVVGLTVMLTGGASSDELRSQLESILSSLRRP